MNRIQKPWETFERLELGSTRLKERLVTVVKAMTEKPQLSIYSASGSRGQAKGAYRMLSNEKFDVSKG
ncbi:hypothetical protein AGMMS49992_28740 [Clostridia bacterium]|nr:hypothetical protein AGMMS49992_28740 [Clostridia bacterium]